MLGASATLVVARQENLALLVPYLAWSSFGPPVRVERRGAVGRARVLGRLRGLDRRYCCMVTVVGSLVMLSITEANPNTPDPDCTVSFA